ncbi:MAG TPA: class III poly(R)-hydroxyalkanoic acid synthase subunit PhaC [Steroidobacteraceae bacterium]|nr:class III poly(R)-hydroxyalkanoic acid synthase subunit PhaC [Steroidobacteraceae bacterium]
MNPETDTPFAQLASKMASVVGALANAGEIEIGTAAKREVYREDKLILYRYEADPEAPRARNPVPLLICYALVNRPYMLDLQPDRSLIRGLLKRGVDVYLIDWGYPDGADRLLDMSDYVLRYLDRCVDVVRRESGQPSINLLGVCQGGTFSISYAALKPERVRNLITMVTPVDFRTEDNLLTKWSETLDVDALVDAYGNIPGSLLNTMFVNLLPFRLHSQKYVQLIDSLDDPEALRNFLRMEKWIFDSPDQPGAVFREFLTKLVKGNELIRGTLKVGGRDVNPKRITMPVLNVFARQDHLVPPSASRPLKQLVGSRDYAEHEFNGGHIGIYVSRGAQKEIPERIAGWLRDR